MVDFIFLWLRGLVFMVAAVITVAIVFGGLTLLLTYPAVMVPILLLVVMPIALGMVTEGDA